MNFTYPLNDGLSMRLSRIKELNPDNIFEFANSPEAGIFLQSRISKGDIILVKGSQGVRTEKIVKEIMADPQFAKELLVRQGSGWK